ncbi:hypothetical protein PFISCL1PPCAC_4798, partial [Pristionchus fissidentatus]
DETAENEGFTCSSTSEVTDCGESFAISCENARRSSSNQTVPVTSILLSSNSIRSKIAPYTASLLNLISALHTSSHSLLHSDSSLKLIAFTCRNN